MLATAALQLLPSTSAALVASPSLTAELDRDATAFASSFANRDATAFAPLPNDSFVDFTAAPSPFVCAVQSLETMFDVVHLLLNGYLTAFFVATGVASNLFSIYIFLRCDRGATPAIQYYLVTLTLWQTALLINAFLMYSLPLLLFNGNQCIQGSYVYIYPYVYTFANTTHTGSVWIVLTLTIDRYLALCQPLKHRAIGKRSRVKRLMIIVSSFAALYSLPRFFEVDVASVDGVDSDGRLVHFPAIQPTLLFYNRMYWSAYHVAAATLFVTLCPCLLLFGLTLRISYALRQAVAARKTLCAPDAAIDHRKRTAACSRKEHKANIMLVLVIAKFLISDILPTVADVTEHIVGSDEFRQSRWASLFVDVSNFLLVLNCSSNFWVFVIWGKRFRQSCRQLALSNTLGASFYRLVTGSEPDLVGICAASSFTATHQSTLRSSGEQRRRGSFGRPPPPVPTNSFGNGSLGPATIVAVAYGNNGHATATQPHRAKTASFASRSSADGIDENVSSFALECQSLLPKENGRAHEK